LNWFKELACPNGGIPMILRRKKDKKKSTDTKDETPTPNMDIGDIEESMEGGRSADERLAEIDINLVELKKKLDRLDGYVTMTRNELEETKQKNKETETNIAKLLSIYELVSKRFNPFIDEIDDRKEFEDKTEENELDEMKPDDELSEKTPWDQDLKEVLEVSPDMNEIGGVTIGEKIPESVTIPSSANEHFTGQIDKLTHNYTIENGKPILSNIKMDYSTTVLVMRWIEFMFERVKRDRISLLLDYYKDVGWISDDIKSQVMGYARGEIQDVLAYEEEDITTEPFQTNTVPVDYKKVNDWRLSAEDHLKSLLFIMKIAGKEVNKDHLNSLEQEISSFKRSLEAFHGV
jgi:flagellar protein FlaD